MLFATAFSYINTLIWTETWVKDWQLLFEDIQFKSYLLFNMLSLREPDQRRIVEIIGHLNKMRFGEQEQSKAKDTKEVRMRI